MNLFYTLFFVNFIFYQNIGILSKKLTLIYNKMTIIHEWYMQIILNATWLQYYLETIQYYLETLKDHPKLADI